jgi:hypothetical protein
MAATAGIILRGVHQKVASTRLHSFVRRYGLWGLWVGFLRSVRDRRLFQHWSRYVPILTTVVEWGGIAAVIGAATGLLLPAIVFVLLPRSYETGLLGEVLLRTGGIAAVLLAALETGLWLSGLSYMARPQVPRAGTLPRLSSHDLSLDVRNNLALNIFWYSRLRWAAIVAILYPWLFLVVTSFSGNSNSSGAHRTTAQPASLGDAIAVISLLALTTILPLATIHYIRRQIIFWKISSELYLLMHPPDGTGEGGRDFSYSVLIIDPLRRQRKRLVRVALDMSYAARVFDRLQAKGLGPHPISTILRAVSRYIRQFLTSQQSLRESIPSDLIDTLSMTLILLCQSKPTEVYQHLAKQVSAFDQDGDPAADLQKGSQSKITAFSGRVTASLRGATSLIIGLATSIAIIVLCVLYIRHRINMNDVLQHLP